MNAFEIDSLCDSAVANLSVCTSRGVSARCRLPSAWLRRGVKISGCRVATASVSNRSFRGPMEAYSTALSVSAIVKSLYLLTSRLIYGRSESKFVWFIQFVVWPLTGTLLRKLENGLRGVSHVIVDEIHERDINVRHCVDVLARFCFAVLRDNLENQHQVSFHVLMVLMFSQIDFQTDFLLVLLRDMMLAFSDLRIVLMSATIDTNLFCEYFGNVQVVEVYGRVHPVQGTWVCVYLKKSPFLFVIQIQRFCLVSSAMFTVDFLGLQQKSNPLGWFTLC